MPLEAEQIKRLVQMPEGTALDFKVKQYEFQKASDEKKANLLKDILAMANSWRGTTAYILIGVDEVKGGNNKLIGVQDHLDDADLQQFVNRKTQRDVVFSYYEVQVESKTVGVIDIPLQERPRYLTKGYGGLAPNVVFTREGSSNGDATPDEVARMGAEAVAGGVPRLSLAWADISNRESLPTSHTMQSVILAPRLRDDIYPTRDRSPWNVDLMSNPNYGHELISYSAQRALLSPIGMLLKNTSSVTGRRIRFVGSILKCPTLVIRDAMDDAPSKTWSPSAFHLGLGNSDDIDVTVTEFADRWEIEIDFGDVRPGDSAWTDNELYIGGTQDCLVRLEGELRGDNLPEPVKCELELQIKVERRAMEPADVLPYLDSE